MLPSGNRKRTAGGIYFRLLKQHVPPAQFKSIFAHNKELFREKILEKNRRRNAKRRMQAGPRQRAPLDAPAATPAPASVMQQALPAWMAAEATGLCTTAMPAQQQQQQQQPPYTQPQDANATAGDAAAATALFSSIAEEIDAHFAELEELRVGRELKRGGGGVRFRGAYCAASLSLSCLPELLLRVCTWDRGDSGRRSMGGLGDRSTCMYPPPVPMREGDSPPLADLR